MKVIYDINTLMNGNDFKFVSDSEWYRGRLEEVTVEVQEWLDGIRDLWHESFVVKHGNKYGVMFCYEVHTDKTFNEDVGFYEQFCSDKWLLMSDKERLDYIKKCATHIAQKTPYYVATGEYTGFTDRHEICMIVPFGGKVDDGYTKEIHHYLKENLYNMFKY